MARKERQHRAVVTVSHRDTSIGRTGNGGGNARYDLIGDACCSEFGCFLSASSKDHRVSALESYHGFPFLSEAYDEVIRFLLLEDVIVSTLARIDFLTMVWHPGEELRVSEGVVDEDVRLLKAGFCFEGD